MIELVASLALMLLAAQPAADGAADRYAEGQVWEYRTRPGDEGSLLKIQRVDRQSTFRQPVYHISIIGFRLNNAHITPVLPHAPVTRQTLDASVTRLSRETPEFPDVVPGIVQWQMDQGGIFTITVADIIDNLEQMVSQQPEPAPVA